MTLNKHEFDGDGTVTSGNGPEPRAPRHGVAMQSDRRLRIFVPGKPDRVTCDPIPPGTWIYQTVDAVTGDIDVGLPTRRADGPYKPRKVALADFDSLASDVGTSKHIGPMP